MIFFCEDCGEKNHLTPTHLKDEKVEFRCITCNYLNSYPARIDNPSRPKKTKSIIKEIHTFPEVIGSFLFHKKKGVQKDHMNGSIKQKDMALLGKILTHNISTCRTHFPDVDEMALNISDKTLTAKMIDPDTAMVILSRSFPLPQKIMDRLALMASNERVNKGDVNGNT